jgi:hypothetical protein
LEDAERASDIGGVPRGGEADDLVYSRDVLRAQVPSQGSEAMTINRPPVAALLVLALATSASAECAWLLWWSQKTIHSSHQTKAECEREIKDIQKARALGGFDAIPMICLPNTVDPREPKGR